MVTYKPQNKNSFNHLESIDENTILSVQQETKHFKNDKYETKFTTNLEDIFEKQQKDYFASSTKVFSDMRENLEDGINVDSHKASSKKMRLMSGKTTLNPIAS